MQTTKKQIFGVITHSPELNRESSPSLSPSPKKSCSPKKRDKANQENVCPIEITPGLSSPKIMAPKEIHVNQKVSDFNKQEQSTTEEFSLSPTKFSRYLNIQKEVKNPYLTNFRKASVKEEVRKSRAYAEKNVNL